MSIKDHKPNFRNNTKCRLLNPTKPNIGQLSKVYTERLNNDVKEATNQWTKTEDATTWFANLPTKQKQKFIQLDVDDMYGSITKELLGKALDWAGQYTTITDEEKM